MTGPAVDTTPARSPGDDVRLEGRFGIVERLDPLRHGDDLWNALRVSDAVWDHLSYGPFADAQAFTQWLKGRAALEDPKVYAIVDKSGRALGLSSLARMDRNMRVVEVGHILYSPALQRTTLATEAQYLLARYAFETLGYRRYEWKCDMRNTNSARAAERFGFRFEGVFRQHMIVKGRSRDSAWYSMLDGEWPARKQAFETWLAPGNFDAQGRQKTSLSELNAPNPV